MSASFFVCVYNTVKKRGLTFEFSLVTPNGVVWRVTCFLLNSSIVQRKRDGPLAISICLFFLLTVSECNNPRNGKLFFVFILKRELGMKRRKGQYLIQRDRDEYIFMLDTVFFPPILLCISAATTCLNDLCKGRPRPHGYHCVTLYWAVTDAIERASCYC
jgi:hypothetical protein